MSKSEKIWFFLLLALIALGWLTSCRTQYVPVPEYHTVTVEKHDTLTRYDSIYQRDSVVTWMQGDTVWKEKYIIRYRDRIVGKTVYRDSVKVDSVRVPYPVERKLNLWERTILSVAKPFIGLVLIALMAVMVWIYKKRHNLSS
jgi:hypothetical protein